MSKREDIMNALKEAMRNKDQIKLSTVRLIQAALKDRDIAARGKGNADGISDDEILSMLQTMVKQRRESASMYREGNREELAAQEEAEITVIEGFLPAQMSDEELKSTVEKLIEELGASEIRDVGKVMGALKSRHAGQVNMGKAGRFVKAVLG
jgi:uncharacterized protein YqeY